MNQKMLSGIFVKAMAMILFLCAITADVVFAQEWAINASALSRSSAGATPANRAPYVPSSISIQQNILAQQRASIQQAITVAQRCIKTNSLSQVLRDPQGNVNVVPQTDLVNCTVHLNALLRQLAANQQASINLAQDAQLEGMRVQRKRTSVDIQRRVQRLRGANNF